MNVKDNGNPYYVRTLNLHRLGYETYEQYLGSPLWRAIRREKLRQSPECFCGGPATSVHHGSYDLETLRGECTDTLLSCCSSCHRRAERSAAHLPPEDRLNAATAALLANERFCSRRRRRRRTAFIAPGGVTWRPIERTAPDPQPGRRMLRVRRFGQAVDDRRPPFDATPRLVKKNGLD